MTTENPVPVEIGRNTKGQFLPGNNANPKGRGGHTEAARKRNQLLRDNAPEVLEKLITEAKNGTPWAMKIVIDKILPTPKSQFPEIELPPTEDPISAANDVINAALTGIISADHASVILDGIKRGLEIKILAQAKSAVTIIEVNTGDISQTNDSVKIRYPDDES